MSTKSKTVASAFTNTQNVMHLFIRFIAVYWTTLRRGLVGGVGRTRRGLQ